jgi:hypothetical protein
MFSFTFDIDNPFYTSFTQYKYKDLFDHERVLTENKILALYIEKYNTHLFEFEISVKLSGEDVACSIIKMNVLGLAVTLKVYDNRRWNYDKCEWMNND